MKAQLRILLKTLPSVPVYGYLFLLAVTSTSLFIMLLMLASAK